MGHRNDYHGFGHRNDKYSNIALSEETVIDAFRWNKYILFNES